MLVELFFADVQFNLVFRFLATTPKHPVIRKALKEFQSWYRVFFTPGQDQDNGIKINLAQQIR